MRKEQSHMSDELLVKYLLGEATEAEQAVVMGWIQAGDDNLLYYEHFKLIWEQSRNIAANSNLNEDEAWGRFQQRIEQKKLTPRVIEMPRRQTAWIRAAAVLLVVIGCALLLRFFSGNEDVRMIAMQSGDAVLIDTLPDGSVVTLNKQSSLSYPSAFGGDTRSVTLTGEAFFNVTPDKNKPFLITANDAVVRVVGTSFNVKSSEAKTEVIVETGKVAVSKAENNVELNPREKAIVRKEDDAPEKAVITDELYNYYRTREFVCNNTPLWRLVDVLNEAYEADIVIANEKLRDLQLTTTFRNEPLDSILAIISETFNIKVEKNGNQVLLK